MEALLALDLGTSAVKCLLLSPDNGVLAVESVPYPTLTPRSGWVEQDPEEWWRAAGQAVRGCVDRAVANVEVAAIGLSGHMSGLCLVDAAGMPLRPCITIGDTRSSAQTEQLRGRFRDALVAVTGNEPLDAFALPKLLWVQEHEPDLFARAHCFLFPKDYLRFRLTGRFATEPTDAGNSMLFRLDGGGGGGWDEPLIRAVGLPPSLCPACVPSTAVEGTLLAEAASHLGLTAGIPVVAGAADMACSALGSGAASPGTIAVTIGTAAQVLTATTSANEAGLGQITYHRHAVPGQLYALGSVFNGGLAMNWLSGLLYGQTAAGYNPRDMLELARLAEAAPPSDRPLWFLPFLVGRGSPGFNADARGAFVGLSLDTSRGALARAVMEGVAFNIRECVELFAQLGYPPRRIVVGGGGFKLPVWRGIVAGALGRELTPLATGDAAALGAAIVAGAGVGAFGDMAAAAERFVATDGVIPYAEAEREAYERRYAAYRRLYRALEETIGSDGR